jgi:hypothetical protein
MERRIFITLVIFTASVQLMAQKVELMFTAGIAGYSMNDLKSMNADLQKQIPFNTSVTTNFPMTLQLGGCFGVQLSDIYKTGLLYAFNSTGSRIASSDYSGSYRFDNVVNGHTIGMMNGFRMYDYKAFSLDFQVNIGMVVSVLKMSEELNVSDTTMASSAKYSAIGVFLEPRAEMSYHWKHLSSGIFVAYFVNPTGRIRNESGQKATATINWSGLRFGIEIGINGGASASKRKKEQ